MKTLTARGVRIRLGLPKTSDECLVELKRAIKMLERAIENQKKNPSQKNQDKVWRLVQKIAC